MYWDFLFIDRKFSLNGFRLPKPEGMRGQGTGFSPKTLPYALYPTPFLLQRSEPSSRIFLIGEQPNPWDLLQPQDKMSRHRGAELRRRYELLGGTSLLSLE